MPRTDIRFAALFFFFLISCAGLRAPHSAGALHARSVFARENFSMFGDMRLRGFAEGYYSCALKSGSGVTDFILIDAMGSGFRDERASAIASEVIDALKGKSAFIKSVKSRGGKIYFRFAKNPFHLKKMTAFMVDGSPVRFLVYFRKGSADIEVSDIVCEKN
ncbi:MAG: hypothetical protein COZ15_01760 [Elusimicrobia bacterium CG_4_10_14_3_um_filter_49_12_50_7]|nr:MAG: hypothetical protein COS41_04765 [Elusimicrobia bacterium CG03_land_8_20_14_0_80_50_18]PIX15844.1 MAG: hypothetical protein COZ72_02560 [Elusimicrobia bacterium CG_4_8_14_3_um_filter_50_9]PIY17856.1 MAG: hypothetical protein COZ15_01760 [Elusimicrobia bacterium CG_4_10_14_3_um_filter_49_12_50_7]